MTEHVVSLRTSEHLETSKDNKIEASRPLVAVPRSRVIPPFIASHDIPRGIFHAVQAASGFTMMLAVM